MHYSNFITSTNTLFFNSVERFFKDKECCTLVGGRLAVAVAHKVVVAARGAGKVEAGGQGAGTVVVEGEGHNHTPAEGEEVADRRELGGREGERETIR